ncbi:hypothetical protein TA3x_001729 [Tundrisphaera sp. TA3]|uniref:hypothetical protein n=1 Tax=Tundrisphaera sp. TA3 TaxID=3435775 RepID=UPI003EC12B6D
MALDAGGDEAGPGGQFDQRPGGGLGRVGVGGRISQGRTSFLGSLPRAMTWSLAPGYSFGIVVGWPEVSGPWGGCHRNPKQNLTLNNPGESNRDGETQINCCADSTVVSSGVFVGRQQPKLASGDDVLFN